MTQPLPIPSTTPFGRDLATFQTAAGIDLSPTMDEATGRDVLSQSLVRRQTTPQGSVLDVPNDCIDLRAFLGAGKTPAEIQQLAPMLQKEILKDERVTSVVVTVTFTAATNTLAIVEDVQSAAGPFSLTITLTPVSVTALVAAILPSAPGVT